MKHKLIDFLTCSLFLLLILIVSSCTKKEDPKSSQTPVEDELVFKPLNQPEEQSGPVMNHGRPLKDIARDYQDALSRHDIEEALSYLDDDFRIIYPDGNIVRGKETVREIMEWDVALNSVLTIDGMEASGNSVTLGRITETNSFLNQLGIDEAQYEAGTELIFRNGLIVNTIPTGFTSDSLAQVQSGFAPLLDWMKNHYPDAVNRLMTPDGGFVYTKENAKEWLTLMREWNDSRDTSNGT